MPQGLPYLPFVEPEQPPLLALPPPAAEPEFVPPPPVAAQAPVTLEAQTQPLQPSQEPGLLDKGPALQFALPPPVGAIPAFDPPPPVQATQAPQQAQAADAPVPISQREYLREAPLEALPPPPQVQKIEYPFGATQEQKAAIDAMNSERQMMSDVGYRAEVEQGLRTAAASAQAALTQDLLTERAKQLEGVQERRQAQLKRREEVSAGVDQDYEELRRLAKEKLPPMSTGDSLALVAVAAAAALNAALNGVQPGQATGTAFQQIVERRARERAQQLTGLENAVGAGERQLGMLDAASQREEKNYELAKAELYEEVALQAEAMGKKATSNEERFRLTTAASDARARAQQAMAEARRKEEEFQLKLSSEQFDRQMQQQTYRLQAQKLFAEQQALAEQRAERLQKAAAEQEEREVRKARMEQEMRLDTEGRTVLSPAGGQRLTYRSQSDAQDIATKVGAAQSIVETIDILQAKRREHGPEWTKWLKTDEGQRMLALYGDLFFIMKDYKGLGVISGPDKELIERVISEDPTAVIALTAMLDETRSQTIRGANKLMKSRLVVPDELKAFSEWNPPKSYSFAPDTEQATTTLRSGDAAGAAAAVQELVDAEKRKNPNAWAENAYRALEREQLALEAERDAMKVGSAERKAMDKRIYAIRKGKDEAKDILGRKRYSQIGLEVSKEFAIDRQKADNLGEELRGIMGVDQSRFGSNPYMDAMRLYREASDGKTREAVLQSLKNAGYNLYEFKQRVDDK